MILTRSAASSDGRSGSLRAHRRRRAGLSLIEVMLALAIFLISLVALAGLVDMGADRELEAQFSIRASRLAQAQMGEIISGSMGSLGQVSSSSGTFPNDSDWTWNATAMPNTTNSIPNLYTVQVTVTRDNRGRPFTYVLTQQAIDPYMMSTAQAAITTPDQGAATTAMYGNGSTGGAP